MDLLNFTCPDTVAVVPVLIGPLAALPAILMAVGGYLIKFLKPSMLKNFARLLWQQKVGILLAAAVIYGGWYAYDTLIPKTVGEVTNTADAKDWPMFCGGPERTSVVPGSEEPTHDGLLWNFPEPEQIYCTPTVVGNYVFINSVSGVSQLDLEGAGKIYCVDAKSGKKLWEAPQKDRYRATYSSPSVSISEEGKFLVVGEGLHEVRDAKVFCLDIENGGKTLWKFEAKSHVETSPAIYKGKVYFGAGDDGYYCLKLKPKTAGQPEILWHQPGNKSTDIKDKDGKDRKVYWDAESSPVAFTEKINGKDRDLVVMGLGVGGRGTVCFDADTGEEIWFTPSPAPVFGPPSYSKGKIFVGMGNGNVLESAEQARQSQIKKLKDVEGKSQKEAEEETKDWLAPGAVWCLEAATGKMLWKYDMKEIVLGAVAIRDDTAYFGGRDGLFYALNVNDGKPKRKAYNLNSALTASPAIGKEYAYVLTDRGILYCLSLKDLEPVWKMSLGKGAYFVSSPTLANGHIYIGTTGGQGLLCIGQPGALDPKPWGGAHAGPGKPGYAEPTLLPAAAKLAWRFPVMADAETPSDLRIQGSVAFCKVDEEGVLLTPLADGPRKGLLAFSMIEEKKKSATETTPPEKWFTPFPNGIITSPAANKDNAYCIDGKPGQKGRALHCLDLKTGKETWSMPVDDQAPGTFSIDANYILIENVPGTLTVLDIKTKATLWEGKGAPLIGVPSALDRLLALARQPAKAGEEGLIEVVDPVAKVQLLSVSKTLVTGPVLTSKSLLVADKTGVAELSLSSGLPLWSQAVGTSKTPLVLCKDKLACVNEAGELCLVQFGVKITSETSKDKEGKEVVTQKTENVSTILVRVPDADPNATPLITAESTVYMSKTGKLTNILCTADGTIGKPITCMDTSWLGKLTAEPVLVNGRIYFATDTKGLICGKEK